MEGSMVGPKILPGILVALLTTMLLTAQPSFAGSTSDECRTSPGPSARAGLHWYYRTDRTNNRQCWYLGNVVSRPTPRPENVAEQAQETQSQNDTVQTELQTSIITSDNNLVTIATANAFQQVIGSNSSATQRQALIIKNDNSNGDSCWVFFGSNKPSKEKSVIVASGDSYVRYWPFVSSDAMQATCASSSDALYVEIK
jgi:hypothetical protein